ncbi:MAG: amidohydrolase family protein [Acidobacteriota bacterium]
MKIDSHQHFWIYEPAEYPWMSESMSVIRRNFLPPDLHPEITAADIEGVVTVQARPSLDETRWLLELAAEHDFIKGVVGWVPLISPQVGRDLETFAQDPHLKGVRHILHDEPDADYMLRPAFNHGLELLKRFGLIYDILIFERHFPQTIRFVDRHPAQVFVVDHVAKPLIKKGVLSPWREHMQELARRENVYCKLSGMVTEADWSAWKEEDLAPYFEVALEAFGPQRLLFGSDWPVCLLACGYQRWHQTAHRLASSLSESEQQQIFGVTAGRAYNIR